MAKTEKTLLQNLLEPYIGKPVEIVGDDYRVALIESETKNVILCTNRHDVEVAEYMVVRKDKINE